MLLNLLEGRDGREPSQSPTNEGLDGRSRPSAFLMSPRKEPALVNNEGVIVDEDNTSPSTHRSNLNVVLFSTDGDWASTGALML